MLGWFLWGSLGWLLGYLGYPCYPSPYSFSSNLGDWYHYAMQTPGPEGAVAARAEDAWDVVALMLEGLERQAVHKKEKQFGKQVETLETRC